MIEFGTAQFDLAQPMKTGGTKRDHIEAVARATRRPRPELQLRCPEGMSHLWGYFCELSNARLSGKPITFVDLKAWSDLTGVRLTPQEISVIRQLDSEFLSTKK